LRFASIGLVALLLAGCDTFLGETEAPPLPGTRIAILETNRSIVAEPEVAEVTVTLPQPILLPDWPQAMGDAQHVIDHPALAGTPQMVWRNTDSIGAANEAQRPLTPPVVAEGRVFLLDAVLNARAFDAQTGQGLWAVGTALAGEHDAFGGGLAVDGGLVFVSGGHGLALALEAATGKLVWQATLPGPVRSAPTVAGGKVLIMTVDNRLVALNRADGSRAWDLPGTAEGPAILGGASPAANDEVAIAAQTTGEIVAVRMANGGEIWRNSLASLRRFDFGAKLSEVAGHPVLAGDTVYAVGAAGRTAAFSLRSGNRLWERHVGGTQAPWIAGEWLFMVTSEAELVALDRRRGFVRWVSTLPRYEDPEEAEGEFGYAGPVLAGGQLLVVRSDGLLTFHTPETGERLLSIDIGAATILPPVVAGGTLYLLANNGTLTAFR
jgi:outer membrane protein assembly factor BamB